MMGLIVLALVTVILVAAGAVVASANECDGTEETGVTHEWYDAR